MQKTWESECVESEKIRGVGYTRKHMETWTHPSQRGFVFNRQLTQDIILMDKKGTYVFLVCMVHSSRRR